MAEVKVFEVFTVPADDQLVVRGTVGDNPKPVVALGWISWTQNYWHPDEHPADPELPEESTRGLEQLYNGPPEELEQAKEEHLERIRQERELILQQHRDQIAAVRRPMTQDELRAYCEQLLLEASPRDAGHNLHVAPLLDPEPEPEPADVPDDVPGPDA